jgi:hypothetical protein
MICRALSELRAEARYPHLVFLDYAWWFFFMRGPVAEIRRSEIENRLKRGLPEEAVFDAKLAGKEQQG